MNTRLTPLTFILCAVLALNVSAATHYVDLKSPICTPPYLTWTTAATNIQDAVDAAAVGDLILVKDGTYKTGGRPVTGFALTNRVTLTKAVTVQSLNGPDDTIIQGNHVTSTNIGDAAVRCVYLTNGATLMGFTLMNGATRNVTDGRSDSTGGNAWCASQSEIISNCIIIGGVSAYGGGGVSSGTILNCQLISNSVITGRGWGGGAYNSKIKQSSLAYNFAYMEGGGAYQSSLDQCTLVGNSANIGGGASGGTLKECLIATNTASNAGGGVSSAALWTCRVIGNQAGPFSQTRGGGLYGCTATNTLIAGNRAYLGGGSYYGTFYQCTIANNTATNGGGVYAGGGAWAYNSIVFYNSAPTGPDLYGAKMEYCCTTPPIFGASNTTNPPAFVDLAGGDFHLQPNSPCINAGTNSYAMTSTDLDGNPRIIGGTVDIGAYESQSPPLLAFYSWLQTFGLPTYASSLYADTDHDGANNWQEWRADTSPTNSSYALRVGTITNASTGVVVSWPSVPTRSYRLERGADLSLTSPFQIIASNITGVAGTTSYNDTTATNGGPYFYRVGVQ